MGIEYEYKYLLAILLSVILGFAIGFERKTRAKEAGVRTHTLVCFGSCLIMVVSKYGFGGQNADVSRVSAQIVTGIGFLGAGIIVYRKNAIHGLTTAAGIWTTAGIGMACGAGLYYVAVGGTVIMICVQCILHINCKIFNIRKTYQIKVVFNQLENENERIKEIFGVEHFNKVVVSRRENIVWSVIITTTTEMKSDVINSIMSENGSILEIERCDEN